MDDVIYCVMYSTHVYAKDIRVYAKYIQHRLTLVWNMRLFKSCTCMWMITLCMLRTSFVSAMIVGWTTRACKTRPLDLNAQALSSRRRSFPMCWEDQGVHPRSSAESFMVWPRRRSSLKTEVHYLRPQVKVLDVDTNGTLRCVLINATVEES